MNFKDFARAYRYETFMAGAFNDEQDFDAFLDDPECGVGNPAFDEFSEEINGVLLPCFCKKEQMS